MNGDLEQQARQRLQLGAQISLHNYEQPLMLTYSGGKDSDLLVELAIRTLKPEEFEIVHGHTTADAPETVQYVRERFRQWEGMGLRCSVMYPTYKGKRVSMWTLIPQKLMPPTRIVRYCCDVLKETCGRHRMIATGVRWAESTKRKKNRGIYEKLAKRVQDKVILSNDNDDKRKIIETCQMKEETVVNPIVDWTDQEVWEALREYQCRGNPLYQCGFHRLGCIGCPMNTKSLEGFHRYPAYQKLYLHAFARMLEERKRRGKETAWKDAREVFEWWTNPNYTPGQLTFDDFMEAEEEI